MKSTLLRNVSTGLARQNAARARPVPALRSPRPEAGGQTLLSVVMCPARKSRGVSEAYSTVAYGKDGFTTVRRRFLVTRSAPVGAPRRPSARDRLPRVGAKLRISKGLVAHSRRPHPLDPLKPHPQTPAPLSTPGLQREQRRPKKKSKQKGKGKCPPRCRP
jgi:hypothetical protein